MKICILDAATLGDDISLDIFNQFDEVDVFNTTLDNQVENRVRDCDVIVVNKLKLHEGNLSGAKNLKLICVAATGFDNIDVNYCKSKNIAVCNVLGYSTDSVAQITVSLVLSLANHIPEYDRYVKDGSYTKSGVQNYLKPVYHELRGKTWGIVGFGNIGKQVGRIAQAFGCELLVYKKNKIDDFNCVSLQELMEKSDIITIHLPLNESTKNIIDKNMISFMKKNALIVNMARGAVWDEEEIANALINKKIAAMGVDVYSKEPMEENHPFSKLVGCDNVRLLPHMSWGSYESRVRCLNEIVKNIKAFYNNEVRNRVDI